MHFSLHYAMRYVMHNLVHDEMHYKMQVLSALMGLSVGWWKSDHNTHHVVCNAVEHDPNIQHMPMLAVSLAPSLAPTSSTCPCSR